MNCKYLLLLLFLLPVTKLSWGQEIGVSGGVNQNKFYDLEGHDGRNYFDYKAYFGYSFGAGISEIGEIPLMILFRYEHYKGYASYSYSALAGSNRIEVTSTKSTLGLGLYSPDIPIFSRLQGNVGAECSFRLYDEQEGYSRSYRVHRGKTHEEDYSDGSPELSPDVFVGLGGRLSYIFDLNDRWILFPLYKVYFGITPEENAVGAPSLRHSLEIGVARSW